MSEKRDDSQERTEQATARKKQQSQEQGLVARSKDFNALMVLLCSGLFFIALGHSSALKLQHLFESYLAFDPKLLADDNGLFLALKNAAFSAIKVLLPFLILIVAVCIAGPMIIGGWAFSWENVALKFERLDPVKGLSKIFSLKNLVELIKSIFKIALVVLAMALIVYLFMKQIVYFSFADPLVGIKQSVKVLTWSFMLLVGALLIITLFDVPFQLWNYQQELRMTKQEVKDEYKDTEGKPEVKSRLARLQRELLKRRFATEVPQADVIITNPTHYAVALKYDPKKMKAPKVVAKGVDFMAEKIMEIAKQHSVPLVALPPLARTVYFHTEIGEEIPSELYVGVAQVLAYVHQLKLYKRGKSNKPKIPNKIDIPPEMVK
ncbi:flagellar biosynthesis protein FlhB [Candidatus Berkiella aquae]|uniref:Flagellar biosynthetic protein FlhB n=1 Tax=Candidatus Berkiella aquae TaxID=295108 RepID=A0A0Q9YXL9_9GAMM|nr:flagellar biosynthesis protein FlhB [Candidatus Berkiella aquae]MCS5711410.1 flagellar biosynthesis protein FlhB [Candidatus Berkiella aquae]